MTDQPPPPLPEDPNASVFGQPAEPVAPGEPTSSSRLSRRRAG